MSQIPHDPCEYCDGQTEERVVTARFRYTGKTIYVNGVPAWVCAIWLPPWNRASSTLQPGTASMPLHIRMRRACMLVTPSSPVSDFASGAAQATTAWL